jgi:hypothetical protein
VIGLGRGRPDLDEHLPPEQNQHGGQNSRTKTLFEHRSTIAVRAPIGIGSRMNLSQTLGGWISHA